MAGITTAIALGVMAAASVYGVNEQIKAADEAKKQQREDNAKYEEQMANNMAEQDKQNKIQAEQIAKEQMGIEQSTAKARRKALAKGAFGRSDTILTGPLGLTTPPDTSGKTLLGS